MSEPPCYDDGGSISIRVIGSDNGNDEGSNNNNNNVGGALSSSFL